MEITIYLCNNKLKAIEKGENPISHSGPGYIIVEDDIVEIPLVPGEVDENNYYVDLYLHSLGSRGVRSCRLDGILEWIFNSTKTEHVGYDTYEINSIKITYLNPDICDWEETRLTTTFQTLLLLIQPTTGDGPIPENKEDVLGGTGLNIINAVNIVPGEELKLYWKFKSEEYLQQIYNNYIYSNAITGGFITAINKPSEYSYEITYDVNIEGSLRTGLIGIDYYNYQVGDWVFVIKSRGNFNDVIPEKGNAYSETSLGFIIPMKIFGTTASGIGL